MVFVRDAGSRFEAPREAVWAFVGSGDRHSRAHGHTAQIRRRLSERSGEYSWEQPFGTGTSRFTMRWTSYWPLGLAYEVTEGPFEGSRFFLVYEPHGASTGVEVVGEFVSPTLSADAVETEVRRFFSREFDQDSEAIRRAHAERSPEP